MVLVLAEGVSWHEHLGIASDVKKCSTKCITIVLIPYLFIIVNYHYLSYRCHEKHNSTDTVYCLMMQ